MNKAFFLIYLVSFLTFAQENYFKYNVAFILNKGQNVDKKYEEYFSFGKDTIQYELIYKDSMALFYPIVKLDNSQVTRINLSKSFVKSRGSYFYNEQKKKVENQKIFSGKTFIVENDFDSYNWELTEEIDTIKNRICRKAILRKTEKGFKKVHERIMTVWYDPSYEHNIFPFGLAGLNGLVVKVNFNDNQQIILDKIEHRTKIKTIQPFKKGKRISSKEFEALIEERMKQFREMRGEKLDVSDQ